MPGYITILKDIEEDIKKEEIMKKRQVLTVKSIYPRFFWRRCHKCGLLFKKEEGWKTTFSLPIPVPNNNTWYICKKCAYSKEEALNIIGEIVKYLYF